MKISSGTIVRIINKFLLLQTWQLQSSNGQAFTLEFYSFNMTGLIFTTSSSSGKVYGSCSDYVQIDDGTSIKRYCNPCSSSYCDDDGNYIESGPSPDYGFYIPTTNPGTFTSMDTITVKFNSDFSLKSNGFLAVTCCSVTVTSNECEYCEAQARVRQGLAWDGPQGERRQSLNPFLELTLKLVATTTHHHHPPPPKSLNTLH